MIFAVTLFFVKAIVATTLFVIVTPISTVTTIITTTPIFAQNWDSFISPSLTEGRYPEGDDEVVVDQSFENYGMKLGDAIQLNGAASSEFLSL